MTRKNVRFILIITGLTLFAFSSISIGSYLIYAGLGDTQTTTSFNPTSQSSSAPSKETKTVSLQAIISKPFRYELDGEIQTTEGVPDFIDINTSSLYIHPTVGSDTGTYSVSIQTDNSSYDITIESVLPSADFAELEFQLQQIIAGNEQDIAYLINDTNRKQIVSWNEDEVLLPGSITKLPYALLILKDVDNGALNLDQTFPIRSEYKAYDSDLMFYFENGREVTLREYLEYLIQESDNTAMTHLEAILGGYQTFKDRVINELQIGEFFRLPNTGSVTQVFQILDLLYGDDFLSAPSRDLLIDIMSNNAERFSNRIEAGVPDQTQVAHKIGNLVSDNGLAVSDAAIVFSEYTDLYIIVMTKDMVNEEEGAELIRQITSQSYRSLITEPLLIS